MARRHERQSRWPLKHWKIGGFSASRQTGHSKRSGSISNRSWRHTPATTNDFARAEGYTRVVPRNPPVTSRHSQLLPASYAHYIVLTVVPRALRVYAPMRVLTLPLLFLQLRARLLLLYKARTNTVRASASLAFGHVGQCLNFLGYIAHIIPALYRAICRYYITGAGRTQEGTTASPNRPSQRQRPNRARHSHA